MNIKKYKLKYSTNEIKKINDEISSVLKKGYLTDGGLKLKNFEKNFANKFNFKYSIGVNSGTSALEIILRCLKIKNSKILIPAYTFVGSLLPVILLENNYKFLDVSKRYLSPTFKEIKKNYTKDVKAIIIVHVNGIITNEIYKIKKFCKKNKIYLIEDCACAIGSSINGEYAGSFGDLSFFSFHHSKIVTSGEGGMIVSNNIKFYKLCTLLRAHGINRKINNWEIKAIGSNYKMHEITAILGNFHLSKIKIIFYKRLKIFNFYNNNIKFNDKIIKFEIDNNIRLGFYKYILKTKNSKIKKSLSKYLKNKKIELPPNLYDNICTDQKLINNKSKLINSNQFKGEHLCLPMYDSLQVNEQHYIVNSINKFIKDL